MLYKILKNSKENLYCEKCDYYANRKGDFKKHLESKKHNAIQCYTGISEQHLSCECGRAYKHCSSYYRHKKNCKFVKKQNEEITIKYEHENNKETVTNEYNQSREVINLLKHAMNDNKKLQEQLISIQKEHNNTLHQILPKIGNTTNNTHNKIINVQMFLDDKCRDAMSIQNFAKQIMITMDDLNKNKTDCISNVVLKNLKPLSITERPFHCTNIKNKEWYVKDENVGWEEDNGEKIIKNTENAIQKKWIDEFQLKYPNWNIDDKLKDKFVLIAGSTTSELSEKLKIKLIKELGKEVSLTNNEINKI